MNRSENFELLMGRAIGWRARQELGTLIEECLSALLAAQVCEETRNWKEMLEELDDFASEGKQLISAIEKYT